MALKKEFEINGSGITGDYLKVNLIKSTADRGLVVVLDIYASKELRDEGKNPISNATVSISKEETDDLKTLIYNKIKSLPEFEGAIDV